MIKYETNELNSSNILKNRINLKSSKYIHLDKAFKKGWNVIIKN